MKYSTTLRVTFSASHRLPTVPLCSLLHGHEYTVLVTVSGEPRKDDAMSPVPLSWYDSVETVIRELDRRNLNDMIGAGIPSVWGVANYLFERLAILAPGLERVEVHESDGPIAVTSRDGS